MSTLFHWDGEAEGRPLSYFGFEGDTSPHSVGDELANRKPQSGTLNEGIELDEPVEYGFLLFRCYADTCVAYKSMYHAIAYRISKTYLPF